MSFYLIFSGMCIFVQNDDGIKIEYRVWNPFHLKLDATILGGVDNIWIVSEVISLVMVAGF